MIQVRASAAAGAGARAWRPLLWRCGRFWFSLFSRGAATVLWQQWAAGVTALLARRGPGIESNARQGYFAAVNASCVCAASYLPSAAVVLLGAFGCPLSKARFALAKSSGKLQVRFYPVELALKIFSMSQHAKGSFATKKRGGLNTYIEGLHALRELASLLQ